MSWGECSLCLRNCPVKAFGEAYDLEIAGKRTRLARFNKMKCARRSEFCQGTCVRVCPVGMHGNNKK